MRYYYAKICVDILLNFGVQLSEFKRYKQLQNNKYMYHMYLSDYMLALMRFERVKSTDLGD